MELGKYQGVLRNLKRTKGGLRTVVYDPSIEDTTVDFPNIEQPKMGFKDGGLAVDIQNYLKKSYPNINFDFDKYTYGVPSDKENFKTYRKIFEAVGRKKANPKIQAGKSVVQQVSELETKKYPKGYGTAKQLLQKIEEVPNVLAPTTTTINQFAKTYDIPTIKNPYFKAYNLYKLPDETKLENIAERQAMVGKGTVEAQEKYLPVSEQKEKARKTQKKRRAAEIKMGGTPDYFLGTKTAQKSHMNDLYSQYITGQNVGYAPGKINQEYLKDLDNKFKSLYKQRKKLLKEKPKDLVKKLEEINQKGARLAGQSQGYKTFTMMDPVSQNTFEFGGQRFQIDPTNIFPGMTEKEIRDFRNTYLTKDGNVKDVFFENQIDKKTGNVKKVFKGSLEDFNNIEKATLFDSNRKAVMDTISKKGAELTEQFKKISQDDAVQIASSIACPNQYADGGRVKFKKGSNCFLRGVEIIQDAKAGKPSALNKLRQFTKTPAGKFIGGGLIELGLEGLFAVPSIAEGRPIDQVLGESLLGLVGFGTTEEEQILKHADPKDIENVKAYQRKLENEEKLSSNVAFEQTVQPETGEESTEDFFTVESLRPAIEKQKEQLQKDFKDPNLEKEEEAYARAYKDYLEANKKRAESGRWDRTLAQSIQKNIYDPTGKAIMEAYETIKDLFADGGRVGMQEGGDPTDKKYTPFKSTLPIDPTQVSEQVQSPGRRGFIKGAGLIGAGIAAFAAGLLRLGRKESAQKLVQKAATYGGRRIDGVPEIISDLIQTIKLKGQVIDAPKPGSGPVVYKYNKYEYAEDVNGFTINKVNDRGDYGYSEEVFQFEKDPETGAIFFDDVTVKPDGDGKLKDVEYGVDTETYDEIADDLAKFNHIHPNDTRFRDKAKKWVDEERLKNEGIEPKPGTELD